MNVLKQTTPIETSIFVPGNAYQDYLKLKQELRNLEAEYSEVLNLKIVPNIPENTSQPIEKGSLQQSILNSLKNNSEKENVISHLLENSKHSLLFDFNDIRSVISTV